MKYRIQIQQVFGGNWKNIEEASKCAEWLEMDGVKPRSRAKALEALQEQINKYKSGAPHRLVAYYPDGTFEVLYTLSCGVPFFPSEPQQNPALSDCAAKFEDAPLYECEIPGTPGRVTRGDVVIYGHSDNVVVVSNESFDRITQVIECGKPNPDLKELMARPVRFVGHLPGWKVKKVRPGHIVRTYNTLTLGIDKFKVTCSARCNNLEDLRRLDAQDLRVCRIEQELIQYEGRRRSPALNRKVAKLRKILRILKRGLYE